jgi:hypothetical protein
MSYELYQMRRDLMKLKADCEDLLKSSRAETELLNQTRVIPAVTPPLNAPPSSVDPNPVPVAEQRQWRFTDNETGQIPPALALKAATNPDLLQAIADEIEERSGHER